MLTSHQTVNVLTKTRQTSTGLGLIKKANNKKKTKVFNEPRSRVSCTWQIGNNSQAI